MKGTKIKQWGLFLIVIGAGAFILPAIGMQFRLIELFGGASSAPLFIIAGIALWLVGAARERGGAPAAVRAPQAAPAASARPVAAASAPPGAQGAAHFCSNCGAAITPGAKFCSSCGHAAS